MTTNTNTGLAYDYSATLAALVKSYKTTAQLKKDYKNLVNLYGKDEAVRLMKGYKANKANEVESCAAKVEGNLTVDGLMRYAFKELAKGGKVNGVLAKLQRVYGQTEARMDWEGFIAKYYPHTMANGSPAQAVLYTSDGSTLYQVYEPIMLNVENAVKILLKALRSLDKGARRVYVSNKPRLVWSEVHNPRTIYGAYKSEIEHEVLKDGEGNTISDKYKVNKVEKIEFEEGLQITDEHITKKEFEARLNSTDEE
jgi:hypothetical protein